MEYQLVSKYTPMGDQPEAIAQLIDGIKKGEKHQTLLGVTGSGKTFTIANVIQQIGLPTLVLSHNKTLAAQLYGEFKTFFPNNAVEYFVSYYDYYQPEAYIASSDMYIEKDMSINEEIEKLRLKTTASLLSGRKDVIVVASVSCIYGMANPTDFISKRIHLKEGEEYDRETLLQDLVSAYYINSGSEFKPGAFRIKGDTIDIFPAVEGYEVAYRIEFWDDEIERITCFNPLTFIEEGTLEELYLYPANLFVTTKEQTNRAIQEIKEDLDLQIEYFQKEGKVQEAERLSERVQNDLIMLQEVGYCSGIENYSRYFDGRQPGARPFCLLDYFPKDFLLVIDESHVTIPQLKGMYEGDRQRKTALVEYGFRLPAAIDNRPLKIEEFEHLLSQSIYVSATPAEYELEKSKGIIVEQVIRPTGLPDPEIIVRPTLHQIDDLVEEIRTRISKNERTLITTLTKRMAEEFAEHLTDIGIRAEYIHSEVVTIRRVEIMEALRTGEFDVLVGVNLLREGLDLPEVSLVAIMDADKEGFLRNYRSLTQTAGRAARNINGTVLFYADKITASMQLTIDETARRRAKQLAYNKKHNITPRQIVKDSASILELTGPHKATPLERKNSQATSYEIKSHSSKVAERGIKNLSGAELEIEIQRTRERMQTAAESMNFLEAAQLRDLIFELQALQGENAIPTERETTALARKEAREKRMQSPARHRDRYPKR